MIMQNLRGWRLARGYSQDGLAIAARVSQGTISRGERGLQTHVSNVRKIAGALDIEIADLMADPPKRASEHTALAAEI